MITEKMLLVAYDAGHFPPQGPGNHLPVRLDQMRAALAAVAPMIRNATLEEAAMVADMADLPDGYQWGREAKDNFYFGKDRAACAIRALATPDIGEKDE